MCVPDALLLQQLPVFLVPCRYLYITIVYNVTYSVALLALFMFYMGAHDLLAPFNPLLKFVLVKSVVFFTFWQVPAASTSACMPCLRLLICNKRDHQTFIAWVWCPVFE